MAQSESAATETAVKGLLDIVLENALASIVGEAFAQLDDGYQED